MSIDTLVNAEYAGNRTPLSIINVAHLDFSDQAYVVGYVAYLIWFWMRRLPGTYVPRLIFYIDEIGGGGGKAAFFPSVAASPSKPRCVPHSNSRIGFCSTIASGMAVRNTSVDQLWAWRRFILFAFGEARMLENSDIMRSPGGVCA